jgi:hypothetical protein
MDGAVFLNSGAYAFPGFPTDSTAWLGYLRSWHPQIQAKAAQEQVRRDFAWYSARDSLVRAGLA